MKPKLIDYLKSNRPEVQWRCAMTDELVTMSERFDVISMYHVLEHIPDPRAALLTIKKLAIPALC